MRSNLFPKKSIQLQTHTHKEREREKKVGKKNKSNCMIKTEIERRDFNKSSKIDNKRDRQGG